MRKKGNNKTKYAMKYAYLYSFLFIIFFALLILKVCYIFIINIKWNKTMQSIAYYFCRVKNFDKKNVGIWKLCFL